jgi:adenylate kinase
MIKEPSVPKPDVQDLEVKDAQLIFNSVWTQLEVDLGAENLRFPKEIFWLNGAPGAGKGTHTEFIMRFRHLTARPIVVSDLLKSPEAQKMKDAGMLVGDREVVGIIFRQLLDPRYQSGAVVDGFPRTKVQVECLKLFYQKLIELRDQYLNSLLADQFKKPHFHIVVLFVDERESVRRQLERGKRAQEHNDDVRESGMGELMELRKTDLDEEAARNRYRTFKEKTYESLKSLREVFYYHFINAHGDIEGVRGRIIRELQYQSSLELGESTYDRLAVIPIANTIAKHARQDLIDRLDSYEERNSELFAQITQLLRDKFIPIVKRHAISGISVVSSEETVFENPLALAMVIDIFSERGYHAMVDVRKQRIPARIDPKTFEIETRIQRVYRFTIRFPVSEIRRGR